MTYYIRTLLRFLTLLFILLAQSVLFSVPVIILIIILKINTSLFEMVPYKMIHITTFTTLFLFHVIMMIVYPMVHVIRWLIQLSQGNYEEPLMRHGFFYKYHRRFWFGDIFRHMEGLTERLRTSEQAREQVEKERQDWIAGISHDLKTPLAYIKGYATMLASSRYDWTKEEVQQYSHRIELKTEEVEQWIQDLNLFVLADQKQLLLQRERISLPDFVREIVLDLANSPLAEGMHFSFESLSPALLLSADPRYLKRPLQNLVMNAIIHNPEETSIHVQVEQEEDHACIQIKDDGVGMERETMERLFDKHVWSPALSPSSSGTGLGLTIAKQLIEVHQGWLEIQSEMGKGTTIQVFLPLKGV